MTSEVTRPPPDAVRDELERVLGSQAFANAVRHTRLLRYLVERTLAGEGDQLKEYVLGTEVFDRADSYDPRLDSIVRVEVRRLRSRLGEYYRGSGSADTIVISIPRGSYVPTFAARDQEPPTASHASPAAPGQRSRSAAMFFAAAGLILLVGAAISRIASGPTPAAEAATGPAIAVLPFQHYSTSESDALLAARLTDAVTTELARLRSVSVASRTSAAQYTTETRPVREIRQALDVDFVMEATAVNSGGSLQVTARIVDANRDRKVWVGEYTITPTEIPSAARKLAVDASDATLKYHARASDTSQPR